MRKFRSILTLVLALVMSVSMVACAEEAVLPSADVEEQGYDFYDGAVEYNEIRDSLGAVPALALRPRPLRTSSGAWRRKALRLPLRCSRMRATT